MTEMEKVIKGLECCNDTSIASLNCEECPYRETDTCSAIARLHIDALILLRKQEPVKPYRGECWPKDAYCCGHCAQALVDTGENNRPKYCPQCGRAVKWDEAD